MKILKVVMSTVESQLIFIMCIFAFVSYQIFCNNYTLKRRKCYFTYSNFILSFQLHRLEFLKLPSSPGRISNHSTNPLSNCSDNTRMEVAN